MKGINLIEIIIQAITLLTLIIGGVWAFLKYFKKKFNQIDTLQQNLIPLLDSIARRENFLLLNQSSLLTIFMQKGIITSEEGMSLTKGLIEDIAEKDFKNLFDKLKIKTNPFTTKDIEKIEKYLQMAREGKDFTPDQAQEFYQLAKIIKEEAGPASYDAQDIWIAAQIIKRLSDFLKKKGWE